VDPTTTLRLRYAALSDVGRVRRDNQDSGFASENLLVIADGVGGAARGDVASSTAVHMLRRLDAPAPENLEEALAGAVHRAHDRIAELVEADPELEGTSTTVTAVLFDGRRIGVAHVGDSRGYLLRDGALRQLTTDHTFVQSLIDEGRITEEESRTHPHRNLILRAVDGVHDTDPDLFVLDVAAGDRILLCSDGCSGVLDNDRLTDILGTGSVDYAAVELVRASLEAGSTDNVTCVVADVVDAEPGSEATGPVVVGAVAEQARRPGAASKSFFRGHRSGDTGELEPVPGDDEDVDPEELRYAPRPPGRHTWLRWAAIVVLVLAVLVAAGVFGYRWTQRQYYVAASHDRVTIYRGIQAGLPGLTLHHPAQHTDVTLQSLPAYPAEQVRDGISAKSLTDAREIVSRLTRLAVVCPSPTASPTPSPTPSVAPSKSPSKSPSAGATGKHHRPGKSATPTPTPTPAPTPTVAPPDCIEGVS
jgi:PPM family protein phosphatase